MSYVVFNQFSPKNHSNTVTRNVVTKLSKYLFGLVTKTITLLAFKGLIKSLLNHS